MADIRRRIAATGKAIGVVCTVSRVITGIMMALGIVGIVTLYTQESFATPFLDLASGTGIVTSILEGLDLQAIPQREVNAVELFLFVLSQAFLLVFLSSLKHVSLDIAEGERPFKVETAKKLRRRAWFLAVLVFWNFTAGALIMLVSLLMSYLIEYGAYLQEKADETAELQEEVIFMLAEVTESKSSQTGQHVRRVSEYARVLAKELGYPEEELDSLRLAAIMHDIGKLMVPNEILEKPGRLTDEEFAVMKTHTSEGGRLLENVTGDMMKLSRTIALDHHERWDGNGYGQGLAGKDISFEGRIVAVADVYDALTSKRSYKEAWDDTRAYNEIIRNAGSQFDPQVVEAFKARYADIDAIRRRFADA